MSNRSYIKTGKRKPEVGVYSLLVQHLPSTPKSHCLSLCTKKDRGGDHTQEKWHFRMAGVKKGKKKERKKKNYTSSYMVHTHKKNTSSFWHICLCACVLHTHTYMHGGLEASGQSWVSFFRSIYSDFGDSISHWDLGLPTS